MPAGRQEEILQCILEKLQSELNDPYLYDDIAIKDYAEDRAPGFGITVSPLGEREDIGTNERDDIDYITLVTRNVHALDEDDREGKSCFRTDMRKLFHNRRIPCGDSCTLYSRVDFGPFAIPKEWFSSNNSVTSMRVFTLVRETR